MSAFVAPVVALDIHSSFSEHIGLSHDRGGSCCPNTATA
jgi:hypothetical protein